MAARQIYVDQMYTLGYGLPLWDPEPRPYEVEIGDLGYVNLHGSFRVLFNVTKPENQQPARLFPDGFEPLQLEPERISTVPNDIGPGFKMAGSLRTTSVSGGVNCDSLGGVVSAGGNVEILFSGVQGSILVLKYPATACDTEQLRLIQEYVRKHHDSWYDFANDTTRGLGLDLSPYDLTLVTGTHKTAAWAMATFGEQRKEINFGFSGGAALFADGHFTFSGTWQRMPIHDSKVGPLSCGGLEHDEAVARIRDLGYTSPDYSPLVNQCMFLRGFKIGTSKWRRIVKRIRANAEPQDLPRDSRGDSAGGLVPSSDNFSSSSCDGESDSSSSASSMEDILVNEKPKHPLDRVIDHIFDNVPDINSVIIHDNNVTDLLKPGDNVSELPALLVDAGRMDVRLWDKKCAFIPQKKQRFSSVSHGQSEHSSDCTATGPLHAGSLMNGAVDTWIVRSTTNCSISSRPSNSTAGGNATNSQFYTTPASSKKRLREEGPPTEGNNTALPSSAPALPPSPLANDGPPPPKKAKGKCHEQHLTKTDAYVTEEETTENFESGLDTNEEMDTQLESMAGLGQDVNLMEPFGKLLKYYSMPSDVNAQGLSMDAVGIVDGDADSSSAADAAALGGNDDPIDFFDFSSFSPSASTAMLLLPDLVSSSSTDSSPALTNPLDDGDRGGHSSIKIAQDDSELRPGTWKENDGGESAFYHSSEWKWDGPMPTLDHPWAISP